MTVRPIYWRSMRWPMMIRIKIDENEDIDEDEDENFEQAIRMVH